MRHVRLSCLWVRHFQTVEALREALGAFATECNASWRRQRHGCKMTNQIKAERKPLEAKAAKVVIVAAKLKVQSNNCAAEQLKVFL
jgi:hypothetical protein